MTTQTEAPRTDPVCGMTVHDLANAPQSTYQGDTYSFCGQGCKTRFDENPQQFTIKT